MYIFNVIFEYSFRNPADIEIFTLLNSTKHLTSKKNCTEPATNPRQVSKDSRRADYESSLQIAPLFRLKIVAFRSNQNIHLKQRISTNKQHRRRIRMFQLSYHGIISDRDPRTRAGRSKDLRYTPRTPIGVQTKQCVDP